MHGNPLFDGMGLGIPIIESDLLPKSRSVTERQEWIGRDALGRLVFRHELRRTGARYVTTTLPERAYYINGIDFVMSPGAAAAVRISS